MKNRETENHEVLKGMTAPELAKMICHLCHDCENCPIKDRKTTWNMRACRDTLAGWLKSPEDKDFWDGIAERSEG